MESPIDASLVEEQPVLNKEIIPTYGWSETSLHYKTAKELLDNGEFEQAMTTIEEGIVAVKEALGTVDDDTDMTLHEAMAPFHYLYGTTLLYSIEESSDIQAVPNDTEDGSGEQGEPADDTQIAFENLEIARVIIEKMIASNRSDKLRCDLSQVYLREGDLQRANGQYAAAIADYQKCLQHRENNSLIPLYGRKIADVHYNIALTYSLQLTDRNTNEDSDACQDKVPINQTKTKEKCFHHFYCCAKTFCGMIASLCGEDPATFVKLVEDELDLSKRVSEQDEGFDLANVGICIHALREQAAKLAKPPLHRDEIESLLDLVDEIQETVDESDNAQKGVDEVAEMKKAISAAVAAQTESENNTDPARSVESVTTIGFGSFETLPKLNSNINVASEARPVMLVRKKQKRDTDVNKPSDDEPVAKHSKNG